MRNFLFIVVFTLLTNMVIGQEQRQKHRFPIWSYHQKGTTTHGLSLGLGSWRPDRPRMSNTNGVKIELIGLGIFMPLIPKSPVSQDIKSYLGTMEEPFSERINGLNISTSGTVCECLTNGIVAGFVGQYNRQVNGLSVVGHMNFAELHNGIQLAFFLNESFRMKGVQVASFNAAHQAKGLQIGIYNWSDNLKGVQIGLWNKNQRRSWPLLNWNFR